MARRFYFRPIAIADWIRLRFWGSNRVRQQEYVVVREFSGPAGLPHLQPPLDE